METKKFNIILIILLVIAVFVIGLLVGRILYGSDNQNETTSNNAVNQNSTNNEEEKDEAPNPYLGKYILTYNEQYADYAESYVASFISLKKDNTFTFVYNQCNDMNNVEGTYSIKDNRIILSNMTAYYHDDFEFHLEGATTIEFKIISDNEIYLEWYDMFACTHAGTKYGTFIKEN